MKWNIKYEHKPIRVIELDGILFFCIEDLKAILNTQDIGNILNVETIDGITYLAEYGLYREIIHAKRFKFLEWLIVERIPKLRWDIHSKIRKEIGLTRGFATIKAVSKLRPDRMYDWKILKQASIECNTVIYKIRDIHFGCVNAYHADIWKEVYDIDLRDLSPDVDNIS